MPRSLLGGYFTPLTDGASDNVHGLLHTCEYGEMKVFSCLPLGHVAKSMWTYDSRDESHLAVHEP